MLNTFIIAEIGINHNGDINIAEKLIDYAVGMGCDAVKFQKRTIDVVYEPEMLDESRDSPWGTTQREQKAGLEFFRAHDLRACFCTNALLSGLSIPEVASLSGHKDWKMLKRYTRIKPEDLQEKVNKIIWINKESLG